MKLRLIIFVIVMFLFIAALVALFFWWEKYLDNNDTVVVYFGRPSDVWSYTVHFWPKILKGSLITTSISLVSLVMAAGIALLFLVVGLLSDRWLQRVERFAAISQTIPILVIVTIWFIIEKSFVKNLNLEPSFIWYCFVPVSISLFFPPLRYGIKGVRDIDTDMKAMLRIWNAPRFWRVRKIYLPQALPHILTGLHVSSSWAVVATLITEGLVHGVGGNQSSIGKSLLRPFSGSVVPGQTMTLMIVATILGFLVYFMTGWVQRFLQKKVFGLASENEAIYPITS